MITITMIIFVLMIMLTIMLMIIVKLITNNNHSSNNNNSNKDINNAWRLARPFDAAVRLSSSMPCIIIIISIILT